MKKNFSVGGNVTVNKAFTLEMKNAQFINGKMAIGCRVMGIVKNAKAKFDSYSLAIVKPNGEELYANIPQWLGKSIMEDFLASGEDVNTYFDGNDIITAYEDIPTSKGNPTYNLLFDRQQSITRSNTGIGIWCKGSIQNFDFCDTGSTPVIPVICFT